MRDSLADRLVVVVMLLYWGGARGRRIRFALARRGGVLEETGEQVRSAGQAVHGTGNSWWRRTGGVRRPIRVLPGWTGCRWRDSRRICGVTCIRSGTGCLRGRIFRLRRRRLRYRNRMAERGFWECLLWATESRRRWWPCNWRPRTESIFHPDSYGYRPGSRRMTRWRSAVSGAGRATGWSIWTSRSSSTPGS